MIRAVTEYSAPATLEWLRNMSPDLRIIKMWQAKNEAIEAWSPCAHDAPGATLSAIAKFTFAGEEYNIAALGDDARDKVIGLCAEVVRRELGLPVQRDRSASLQLERDVVAAAMTGNVEVADAIGRQLVVLNASDPAALNGRVRFSKREAW